MGEGRDGQASRPPMSCSSELLVEVRTAEDVAAKLHDAEIDFASVRESKAGVDFSGVLYGSVRRGRLSIPAKFSFTAQCKGATRVVVDDPEGVGWLSIHDANFDPSAGVLVLSGSVPGTITISTPSVLLAVEQAPEPTAIRGLFRWKPVDAMTL